MTHIDYSIVICTYNPDIRLLERCLKGVDSLDRTGLTTEVILVDNNSTSPIRQDESIARISSKLPDFRVVEEKRQGLLFARICGIQEARGRFIVFFDDDNEPADDYLVRLHELVTAHPNIGAWGPGNVWVDFIDGIDEGLREYALPLFQERHESHTAYACVRSPQSCYPYGTGLAISRLCAEEYAKRVALNEFSLTGRQGQQLSSGEDTQMVLCCVRMGYGAGISPELKTRHIIPAKRANYAYIKKLTWGTLLTYDLSIRQVFPEHPINSGKPLKPYWKMNFKIMKRFIKMTLTGSRSRQLDYIYYIALVASTYLAIDKPQPWAIGWATKKLGITHLN